MVASQLFAALPNLLNIIGLSRKLKKG